MNYGLFTDTGNEIADKIVNDACNLPLSTSNTELYKFLTEQFNEAEKQGHGEIWDTECREVIITMIENISGKRLTIYF